MDRIADDVIRKFAMSANYKVGKTEALLDLRGPTSRVTEKKVLFEQSAN